MSSVLVMAVTLVLGGGSGSGGHAYADGGGARNGRIAVSEKGRWGGHSATGLVASKGGFERRTPGDRVGNGYTGGHSPGNGIETFAKEGSGTKGRKFEAGGHGAGNGFVEASKGGGGYHGLTGGDGTGI